MASQRRPRHRRTWPTLASCRDALQAHINRDHLSISKHPDRGVASRSYLERLGGIERDIVTDRDLKAACGWSSYMHERYSRKKHRRAQSVVKLRQKARSGS
jgi:hypothetical protein